MYITSNTNKTKCFKYSSSGKKERKKGEWKDSRKNKDKGEKKGEKAERKQGRYRQAKEIMMKNWYLLGGFHSGVLVGEVDVLHTGLVLLQHLTYL